MKFPKSQKSEEQSSVHDLLEAILHTLNIYGERIMANQSELQASLDQLASEIQNTSVRVNAKLDALNAKVTSGASDDDITKDIAEIKADVAKLGTIGADASATPAP